MNWIKAYVDAIDDGLVVNRKVERLYRKLLDEINSGKYRFDEKEGERPIRFAETFCVPKDSRTGRPIKLELFQKAFLQAIFGIKTLSGKRRFKEVFMLMARKNGKTTLLSVVMLYMLLSDGENGAEVYSVATKLDQAKKSYDECRAMVQKSPHLKAALKKRQGDLYNPATFGILKPQASDSYTLDGLNSHAVVMDELHAIKDRKLYEVMYESMGSRRQPMMVMITTAGTVRESIFDEIYKHANEVLDGIVEDDTFFPLMYELDDRSEWTDESKWIKANPGLGKIKQMDYMRERVQRAMTDVARQAGLLTKEFNILGVTDSAWLDYDTFYCDKKFEIEQLRSSYACAGVDLSSTTDLTCATLLIVKDGIKYVIQQHFLPADGFDNRAQEERDIPWELWVKTGQLKLCEGPRVNYSDVTAWFMKMRNEYEIIPLWVGYDSWNANYWVEEMKACGFVMEPVIQGPKTMSSPMKDMYADLKGKLINYNMSSILMWQFSNTAIKVDDNANIRPVRGREVRRRIDGVVSLIDAYVVLSWHTEDYNNMMR